MISSLSWVPRGASKSKPLRYEVSQRELEEMMREQRIAVDEEVTDDNDILGDGAEGVAGGAAARGDGDDELPPELRMDDYDNEPGLTLSGPRDGREGGDGSDSDDDDDDGDHLDAMEEEEEEEEEEEGEGEGDAMGVSLLEEPSTGQVFAYESEGEDSDTEDNIIKPGDHVLLTASTEEDEHSALEVQVYSEETGNLYVHHDIALPSLPLCLAWMDMPPRTAAMSRVSGSADEGHTVGSYCAVGTFEPGIEIWNLDVLDPLEPTATLGGFKEKDKKPGKKPRKRQTIPGSHTDAVLALSWNREHRHVLASGSGDNTVKVWDVTTQQCSATLTHHSDKVQGVAWHPVEATVMATVGYDRVLALLDARAPTKVTRHKIQADPECLLWNPHNPAQILTGSEDGVVCCRDVRRPESPVYSFTAHEKGVSAVSFTPLVPGMLATCSEDKTVKVWDVDAEVPLQVASKAMAVGRLFSLQYDASTAFLLATAGSKGHVALWHSDEDEAISARFSGRVVSEGAAGSGSPAAASPAEGATAAPAEGGALGGFLAGAGAGELQEGLGEPGAAGIGDGGGGAAGEAEGAGDAKKKKKKKKSKKK
ncbi:unnamed protein product [Ectocarpus sp. CCAP 1310/34]|nr:unnamed protein product [Ectocarpus sp. CCAP 1310/34]